MGVVDGCDHREARHVTEMCVNILCTESFHLIPHKAYFGMMMTRCGATSQMGVVNGCGH